MMQDTSTLLTRWALQSFVFTILHKPGRLHYIPDMLSCPQLEEFCKHEPEPAPLIPVCRNVGAETTASISQASMYIQPMNCLWIDSVKSLGWQLTLSSSLAPSMIAQ
ncbi:unnamed protein product [Choristocarpus tenellus]